MASDRFSIDSERAKIITYDKHFESRGKHACPITAVSGHIRPRAFIAPYPYLVAKEVSQTQMLERSQSMDITEAIRMRKSIRGYKPDPVHKEVLKEILDIAIRSPSALNTQPWEITVITGEVLDNIRRGNTEMVTSGAFPNPDVVLPPFEGVYRERQVGLAKQLFGLMGIAREDKEGRNKWMERGFRFLDAPAAIIISVDRSLGEYSVFDVGAISQTICLAALKHGLGTCIQEQAIMYPEVVRRCAGIPESKRIVIAIAIGYPDPGFPANRLESEREVVENVTTWHGFLDR